MAGHGRSKEGVALLAYVPAIHVSFLLLNESKTWMAATSAGMTERVASKRVALHGWQANRAGRPSQPLECPKSPKKSLDQKMISLIL
jgi:hypothetical protein